MIHRIDQVNFQAALQKITASIVFLTALLATHQAEVIAQDSDDSGTVRRPPVHPRSQDQPLSSVQLHSQNQPRDLTKNLAYVRHQSVVYKTYSNKEKLTCDVYVPEGPGPFPTILMIHGGAWKSGTKLHMKGHAVSAARQGFVAVSINYRHAPRHKWPAQRHDCEAALEWMLKHAERYKIDKSKIALWGYSAGGHLATFLATVDLPSKSDQKNKHPIRCVVCGGGPVDLTIVPKDFPFLSYFLGATRRQKPQLYKSASPITHLSKDDPPMFFYHGEKDFMVPISAVKSMVKSAKQLGIDCELMMVPQKEHMLTFFDQASFDQGLAFIRKVLSQNSNQTLKE